MPLTKNQRIPLTIDSLSSDGNGVGHYEGEAIFVPSTAPGDVLQVRIVKDCKRYAFGIVDEILTPSPSRIALDCKVATPCGGCCTRHLDYSAECRAKEQIVADAFTRIGGFALPVLPLLPSPDVDRYRNKAQFPVGRADDGKIITGFYAGRTHRIVPCADCKLQPTALNEIAQHLCAQFEQYGIAPYDEITGEGLVRHIFLRDGVHSGQIMVCLVCNGTALPHSEEIIAALCAAFPAITTVVLNTNTQNTNVILGRENKVLCGKGYLEDTLAGVPVQIGVFSFYQVNTRGAEQLYACAADFATLQEGDVLLDLYCGMGTIGLSMVDKCKSLIGVEIVAESIESAKKNAARMDELAAAHYAKTGAAPTQNIAEKTRFLCADAGTAAQQLAAEGLRPDVIIVDPPRKGCDAPTLEALIAMSPRRIVMVSCNPATAARDAKYLAEQGYSLEKIQPVDMFARTKHVECVCLFERI